MLNNECNIYSFGLISHLSVAEAMPKEAFPSNAFPAALRDFSMALESLLGCLVELQQEAKWADTAYEISLSLVAII